MSFPSHSIPNCPQLNCRSSYQLLLNLSQLSATPIIFMIATLTAPMKSQLCSWSLHWSLSNLPQLSTAPITSPKSQLLTLFIKIFKRRVIDTNEFPFIIDVGHICHFVAYYKRHIEFCVAVMSRVCCCGLFVSLLLLIIVLRSNLVVVAALNKNVINMAFFNYYGREIDEYWFCYLCFNRLKQKKISKFSSVNKVNIVMCQNYPPTLKTLTLIEEMLIA